MNNGKVLALFLKPKVGEIERKDALQIVAGSGIEGDMHFARPWRQVLFVSKEDLDFFGYGPGDWREQVTVDLPGLQALPEGTPVTVGEIRFEVAYDCAPCNHLAKRLGEEPDAFVAKTTRRRGMFLNATQSGTIRVGDAVRVSVGATNT